MPTLPGEGAHPADGGRPLPRPLQAEGAVRLAQHERLGQERDQVGADPDRAGPRPAPAVGRRERLVDVEVHDVEAGGAGPELAQQRVEVGPVHVGQGAGGVDHLEELHDPLLEEPERRGVGDHHRRRRGAERRPERLEVHPAVGGRGDVDRPEAGHRRGRRVRPVGRVGHEDVRPGRVAAGAVVGPDHEDPGQLALGAGRGLERDGVHAADLGEVLLEAPEELERALGRLVGGQGMEGGEAGQAGRPLVDLGVVLHGARAEGVEARVHAPVELGEVHVVADEGRLVELGECRAGGPPGGGGEPVEGVCGRRREARAGAAAGPRALEEGGLQRVAGDAHRTASTGTPAGAGASSAARAAANRPISAGVVTSVAHTSRPSARAGSPGSSSASGMPARIPRARRRRWTVTASGTRTANSLR